MTGDVIALLDSADEVDVETVSASGIVHSVPIWVVVVDGAAYVASVNLAKARWHRELSAREGALIAGGRRIAVRAQPVDDPRLREQVAEEYAQKYQSSRDGLASMQRPGVFATTLRLEVLG